MKQSSYLSTSPSQSSGDSNIQDKSDPLLAEKVYGDRSGSFEDIWNNATHSKHRSKKGDNQSDSDSIQSAESDSVEKMDGNRDIVKNDETASLIDSGFHPPDGGYGWVIVAASFVVLMLCGGVVYSIGILYTALIDEFDSSYGVTAWVGSVNNGSLLLFGAPVGQSIAMFGVRKIGLIGAFISALGLGLSSLSTELWHMFLGYGLVAGIGFSMIINCGITVVNQYFEKKRGLAVGIAVAGTGVGTIAFAPFAEYLIKNFDFRAYLQIAGALQLVSMVIVLLFKPLPGIKLKKFDGVAQFFSQLFDVSLLRDPVCLCISLSMLVFGFGYFTPIVHVVEYAEDLGIDGESAALLVSWFGVASTIGRMLMGLVADNPRFSLLYTFCFSLFASGVVTSLAFLYQSELDFIVFVTIFGFFSGSFISLMPVLLTSYMGINQLPQAFGMILTFQCVTNMVGPPIAGFIHDANGSYDVGFVLAGCAMAICSIPFLFLPHLRKLRGQWNLGNQGSLIDVV